MINSSIFVSEGIHVIALGYKILAVLVCSSYYSNLDFTGLVASSFMQCGRPAFHLSILCLAANISNWSYACDKGVPCILESTPNLEVVGTNDN
jgi:hypothetical protein